MKNLKQVLALGMAFSLTFSAMASAAYTDQADIKAAEAVDMLSALGVINGYEDGSFKPEGTVTRAEAAKMIFTIRNGGNDNADSYKGVPSSFTDIKGHWAEGYIKYCQSMGIIAGKSATSFDPNGTVTGVELTKMMLVTLGYNAEKAGLVGSAWSTKTLGLAGENGLLNDANFDLAAGCPRQYAAQIMYNAVLAPTVVLRDGEYTNKDLLGKNNQSIGGKYMGLIETEVTLNGDEKIVSGLKDGEAQVTVVADQDISEGARTITYKVANIESKIGENYNLLWKDSNTNKNLDKNDKVYGMYLANSNTVLNVTANDIEDGDTNKVKISGTQYEVADKGFIKSNYYGADTTWSTAGNGKTEIQKTGKQTGDKVRVILNDSNKITALYVVKSDLYKVTAVSGTKVSIAGIGTVDTSKNDTTVYEGIAKNDVVAVTQLYNGTVADATFIIEKAETVSGKVTGFKKQGATNTKSILLDGTNYNVHDGAAKSDGTAMKAVTDDAITAMKDSDIDANVTLYLVNGYVRAAQRTSEEATQYAIVNDVNGGTLGSTFAEPKAELIFADGTKKTVVLHKDSKIYEGTNDTYSTTTDKLTGNIAKNQIVKYVEMSNGQYKIEEIGDYDQTSASGTVVVYDKGTKTFDKIVTSGDCVLFYNDGKDLKATTVRSLGDIKTVDTAKDYAKVVKDGKVVAAYVNMGKKPSGATTSTVYGIVTSDATTTSKDGDTYNMYTVATNDGEVSVYLSSGSLTKGALVSFDKSANDTYTGDDFKTYDGSGSAKGDKVYVTEYNEADKTITYGTQVKAEDGAYVIDGEKTTKAVDNDVKIAYIDAKNDKAGDSGFGVGEFDATTDNANAILVLDDDKVVAIFVNTNNEVAVDK